ncbi:hypothetical protein KDH_67610 [Dictyobacter sp. S3.2.2.5]|uniref:SMP-30/Gluconolactonase/LRE-like region domain-containing protein n=1 Tax=Dictyobacter halimunensis TaxID=3026934 RepID=A0ABQ6G5Q1_9CHLR|nr:hypothetical protein KDH_67610 [Dictyobacter sp. S3.2.2.5]
MIFITVKQEIFISHDGFLQRIWRESPVHSWLILTLITLDGRARKVADDLSFPNGMVITPDNATLIVSESFTGRLLAFDIASDGSLSNPHVPRLVHLLPV